MSVIIHPTPGKPQVVREFVFEEGQLYVDLGDGLAWPVDQQAVENLLRAAGYEQGEDGEWR